MINNNIVSKYLESQENLYSSLDLNDNVEMFNSDTTISDESIFFSSEEYENKTQPDFLIFSATGKDSSYETDEITKLFSTFSKNNEFLDE